MRYAGFLAEYAITYAIAQSHIISIPNKTHKVNMQS